MRVESKIGSVPAITGSGFVAARWTRDVRVLLIEDHAEDAARIRGWLSESREPVFCVECASELTEGLRWLEHGDFDLMLVGMNLAGAPGMLALRAARAAAPGIPAIALSETHEVAREAMHLGASDLLIRGGFTGEMLIECLEISASRSARRDTSPSGLM